MMLALMLTVAGLGAAPQSTNRDAWLRASDYLRLEGALILPQARIELTVDPNGDPVHCNVLASSEAKGFDNRFCLVPMRRARFRPARDEDGRPITGVFSTDLLAGDPHSHGAPWTDYVLTVSALPSRHPIAVARVVTAADGHVESCVVEATSGAGPLDEAACRFTRASMALAAPFDRDGRPVRAMRLVSIGFAASVAAQ